MSMEHFILQPLFPPFFYKINMFLVHNVLYFLLNLLKQAQTVYLTKVVFLISI